MTNEFKIISEDGLKTLCKAIKKVSTVGEILDDVNSVTDKTYSSFEIDRRLNTKANDSEVVKKTDIVDKLTSTDTDKPLSANQGKILNDTKLNKTDANKMNCVSIDNVSLKEYILTNCTEREKTYYLIAKTTCTDLPKASNFYITVETPGLYTYKVTAKELNDSNGIYVSTYRTISSSWTAWQKVCASTVADVSMTVYSLDTSCDGVYEKGDTNKDNCWYAIRNGWCIVQIDLRCLKVGAGYKCVFTSLPKPIATIANVIMPNDKEIEEGDKPLIIVIWTDGMMKAEGGKIGGRYIGTFSYPVAE